MDDDIYKRFEELLVSKGITAYKVSKNTGITTTTLTNWKKGKYVPKAEKLQKIADYLGVTLDYLMNGTNEKDELPRHKEQSELWVTIRHDKKMLNALEKFYKLSEKQKEHVFELIEFLSEVAK